MNEILQYKRNCEVNIISSIYKDPETIYDINLVLDDFSHNFCKVFFQIAKDILVVEKKKSLDSATIGFYLSKHPKLRKKYEEYGGLNDITIASKHVNSQNIESYVNELKKWNSLLKLSNYGIDFSDKLPEFVDLSSDEIYDELELIIQNSFMNAETRIRAVNALDGLDELIEHLNDGEEVGFELSNAKLLNQEIGGINCNGHIYAIGANTGVGKSTMMINYLMPTVIKENIKMVVIINEEDEKKVKKELLVWVANNVYGGYVDSMGQKRYVKKWQLRNGSFDNNVREVLVNSANYLMKLKDNRNITVIPLVRYTAKEAIKIIKKYSSLGVKLFAIDTFKESADIGANEQTWKSMERDARALYDVIKPEGRNVGLVLTYQLAKGSVRTRYLSNADVGQSKNILDVISCNIMMRRPFPSELQDGKRELKVFKIEGKSTIPLKPLKPEDNAMIIFITKNRFGTSNGKQIVSKCDLETNIHEDIGYTYITEDW